MSSHPSFLSTLCVHSGTQLTLFHVYVVPISADELSGDINDIKRVSTQCLNSCAGKRLVSRQEAVVMCAELPFTLCSETIETVSISNSKRLRQAGDDGDDKTFIDEYKRRPNQHLHMSLHEYFGFRKNRSGSQYNLFDSDHSSKVKTIIPHFCGLHGYPTYPLTAEYAHHSLIVYRPWSIYPSKDKDIIQHFELFLKSQDCPDSCMMQYERVLNRYIDKTVHAYPKASFVDHRGNPVDPEDADLMQLCGLADMTTNVIDDYDTKLLKSMPKGQDYKWDSAPEVGAAQLDRRSEYDSQLSFILTMLLSHICPNQKRSHVQVQSGVSPQDWLVLQCKQFEKQTSKELHIPIRDDGKPYSVDALFPDQRRVVAEVMKAVHDWMECEDPAHFKPLRMIVNGAGGSGKSVVLHTIVSSMRTMFQCNDVVKVVGPTGVAACNVGGETFHHMLNIGVDGKQYQPGSMAKTKRELLVTKFKTLLALLIDERSMVPMKIMGTCEQMISETIFEGGRLRADSFGGLPIVVLFGDDYQLPSTDIGALHCLSYSGSEQNMTAIGRDEFIQCSRHVIELTSNKRMKDSEIANKAILEAIRLTEAPLTDNQVNKLLSLHLDQVKETHGLDAVREIEKDAIYLFFKNVKRARKNLECLSSKVTKSNPLAILKPHSSSVHGPRGKRSHFKSKMTEASLLCRDAKVAIEMRNFNPIWGLHNGACGTVSELVFPPGANPNHGDLPLYVAVDFPNYTGPPWDLDNPTVCYVIIYNLCMYQSRALTMYTRVCPFTTGCTNPSGGISMYVLLLHQIIRSPNPCICTDHSQVPGSVCWACGQWQDPQYVQAHHM